MIDRNVRRFALTLMKSLDTPVSLSVYLMIVNEEWGQIARKRISPHHYLDCTVGIERFSRDYQAVELLRKYAGLPTGPIGEFDGDDGFVLYDIPDSPRDAAVKTFYACEHQCAETNIRLSPYLNGGLHGPAAVWKVLDIITDIQKQVKKILGPVPNDLQGKFGPGAIYESKGHPRRKRFTLCDKMTIQPASTPLASLYGSFYVYQTLWGAALMKVCPNRSSMQIVRGNRFTTVPKDATKDRGICIEPGVNVFLQLAVGRELKQRLKNHGIDLKNGQSLHRRLARAASLSKKMATIDLSNASDTVSSSLVKLLLPEDWHQLLSDLRSPVTFCDGKSVVLEKFSSMGNGFTFELETLIFLAISEVICNGRAGKEVFVYGDDIICPTDKYKDLLAGLRFFGFTANDRKCFADGMFRESCGGDYFNGRDVRPFYLEEEPNDPAAWIGIANGMWRKASIYTGCNPYRSARLSALGNLPRDISKCRGPELYGDLVIHDHRQHWNTVVRQQITYVRVWRPVFDRVKLDRYEGEFQLAAALYGAESLGLGYRDNVSGYRFGRLSYS